jgi:hypothetical protein
MSQKAFWAGAAFVVVIAITSVTLWEVAAPDTDVAGQLAALNTKDSAIDSKLAQLDAKMEKAAAVLAELQKGTPLKSLAAKLDALNTRKTTSAARSTPSPPI